MREILCMLNERDLHKTIDVCNIDYCKQKLFDLAEENWKSKAEAKHLT